MNSAEATSKTAAGADAAGKPRLRLVDSRRGRRVAADLEDGEPNVALHSFTERVLVAGGDPAKRARMLAELRSLLPADTDFREASETWEVIAQACDARLVVLADDVGDTSASALLRLLARRNPALPVLAVGGERRSFVSARAGETGDARRRPALDAAHA